MYLAEQPGIPTSTLCDSTLNTWPPSRPVSLLTRHTPGDPEQPAAGSHWVLPLKKQADPRLGSAPTDPHRQQSHHYHLQIPAQLLAGRCRKMPGCLVLKGLTSWTLTPAAQTDTSATQLALRLS